jgi:PadR family transcriptional regulator PadR
MRPTRTDLLQGTLDLIILQLLQGGATNGWDLTLRIQATSKDVLSVNAGSLYPALYRLESRGLIKATWKTTAKNRRAKYYALTAKGRRQLAAERTTWERFAGAVTAILSTKGKSHA